MTLADNRLCDLVAVSPAAEEVLEDAGIDYWFGWERPLRVACEAAHIDVDELSARLSSCRPSALIGSQPAKLVMLLRDSDEQWRAQLAPAIAKALVLAGNRHPTTTRLLKELQTALNRHMKTSRSLEPAADDIEQAQAGSVDRETIRSFRLDHLDLARIAADLREEAARLRADAGTAALADALRIVIRETHRHIKVAHNFILPRLVAAAVARSVVCEPW